MTNQEKVQLLLRAPWSIYSEPGEDGTYIVLRIRELPEFLVTGEATSALEAEFWTALESLIESYVEDGNIPPLPAHFASTWHQIEELCDSPARSRVQDGAEVESRGDPWGAIARYDEPVFA